MIGPDVPEKRTVAIGGRRLNLCLWGREGDPALLLIHGMRDHARSWDWIAAALASRYRVIVPDLRGHGDSDWAGPEGYSLAAYVFDMAEITRICDIDHYAVVGHSLGGAIGLRLAAAFPDKVAALVGIECVELPIMRDEAATPTPYPIRLRQWIDQRAAANLAMPRHYASMADARDRMAREQPSLAPDMIDHLVRHALAATAEGGWRWKFDHAARLRPPDDQRGHDLDEVLTAVTCPVLLAYGDAGWVPLPAATRLARLRDHRLALFPGGGHWLHHEQRDRFIHETTHFLDTQFRSLINA